MAEPDILYRAEPADALLVEPLDMMTAIYQRRSGITHLVASPVPEMLEAMGADAIDAVMLADRLAAQYDFGSRTDAVALIQERLQELARLGLVERVRYA